MTRLYRTLPGLRAVVSGLGCVTERLSAELTILGVERPLVICGANVAVGPTLACVRKALGPAAVVFPGSRPHTPWETVDAGAEMARATRCDGLVAVGGSAAVDCAKGVAVLLATEHESVRQLEPLRFQDLFAPCSESFEPMPLVAVTTTLSFAEFLPFWGARHPERLRKLPYPDLGCVDRTIFLDGSLAAHTPDPTWLETGVKALDDAFSAYCRATGPEPFLDPLLERAIGELVAWLPRSTGRDTAETRQQILVACWMTKFAVPSLTTPRVAAWLSTAARHSLGAVCEVRHGAASCVALPEALRFHADATRDRQRRLAAVLGWTPDDRVPLEPGLRALLGELSVPMCLSDLGIGRDALDEVVTAVLSESPSLGAEPIVRESFERML